MGRIFSDATQFCVRTNPSEAKRTSARAEGPLYPSLGRSPRLAANANRGLKARAKTLQKPYPRSAIWSVMICVRSGFFSPCSDSLNLSTLLDQFMLQNFGPHMLQNAASL